MADKELSRKVISRLIKDDGRSLTEIADDLNVSRQRLGQYQNGKRFPDADFIQKWAKKFGHNLMELMEKETDLETNVSRETGKHTSVQKEPAVAENTVWEVAAFRKIIEGDAEYVLVHKTAFENHRFTSLEQIEANAKELAEARAEVQRLVREFIEFVKDTRGLGSLPELPKIQETKKDTAV